MKAIGVGAVILAVGLQAGAASAQQAGRRGGGHASTVASHLLHDAQVLDPNDPRVARTALGLDHASHRAQQAIRNIDTDAAIIAELTGMPVDADVAAIEQAVKNDLAAQEKKLTAYAEANAGDWIAKGESIDGVLQQMSTGVTPSQHPRVPQNILDEIRHVVPHDQHFEAAVAKVDAKLDQVWTDADKARHLQQQIEGAGAIVGILTGLPVSGAITNVNAIADAELKQVEADVAQHFGGAFGVVTDAGGVLLGGLQTFDDATRDRDYQGEKQYSDNHAWSKSGDKTIGGGANYGDYVPDVPIYDHTIYAGGYGHQIVTIDKKHQVFGYGDPNGMNHLIGGYEVTGSLGYEAKGNAGYQVTSHSVAGQAGADVFVGAKAGIQETFDYNICGIDVKGTGTVSGNAGAGADIGGHFSIDWSNMSISIGGNVGATLGLGADVSGEVTVSLGGVFQHPGQALGCVWDGVKKLGALALKAGEKLVTAAWNVEKTAVTTLAKGAVSVAKAVGNGIKSVASGIGHALGGLFHHHHKKKSSAPPKPPVDTQTPSRLLPVDVNPWSLPGLATLDLGWKMPEGDLPTDMPMAAGDQGANVGRDSATMPNADNGWGYGANAYTTPGATGMSPSTGAGTGTATAGTGNSTRQPGGWVAR